MQDDVEDVLMTSEVMERLKEEKEIRKKNYKLENGKINLRLCLYQNPVRKLFLTVIRTI